MVFDPMSISAALSSTKAILDILRNANDVQLAIKINAEVVNVQGKLIDVQQQILAIQEETQQLRSELTHLKSYDQRHSVMWRKRPDQDEDGPFCPACLGEGREMHLIPAPDMNGDANNTFWLVYCPKGHANQKAHFNIGHMPITEPIYRIPKEMIPNNRFAAS